jgi:predicted transcriptional regulator
MGFQTTQSVDKTREKLVYYWNLKGKDEKGLTQSKAAKMLDISQPAFSFYLTGKNPSSKTGKMAISTDFIRKFAAMVGVKPSDIDPTLQDMDTVLTNLKKMYVPIKYLLSGYSSDMKQAIVHFPIAPKGTFAVEVDVEGYNGLKKGQLLICDPNAKCHDNDMVVLVESANNVYYGVLRYLAGQWVVTYTHDGKTHNRNANKDSSLYFVMAIQNGLNTQGMVFP